MSFTGGDILLVVSPIAILQALAFWWIKVRLQASIKAEYDRLIEEYKFEIKAREQAAKVAEYLAIVKTQDLKTPNGRKYGLDYQRANRLAWEVALWLPEEQYRDMAHSLVAAKGSKDILQVIVDIRKVILKDKSGNLLSKDILIHAPTNGKD